MPRCAALNFQLHSVGGLFRSERGLSKTCHLDDSRSLILFCLIHEQTMEKTPDPTVEEAEHEEESAPLLPDLLTSDEDPEKQAATVKPAATPSYYIGSYLYNRCPFPLRLPSADTLVVVLRVFFFTVSAMIFRTVCENTKCTTCTELTLAVLMCLNFLAVYILQYIGP